MKHDLKRLKNFTKILGQRMKNIQYISFARNRERKTTYLGHEEGCIKDEEGKVLVPDLDIGGKFWHAPYLICL